MLHIFISETSVVDMARRFYAAVIDGHISLEPLSEGGYQEVRVRGWLLRWFWRYPDPTCKQRIKAKQEWNRLKTYLSLILLNLNVSWGLLQPKS